ncbi:shikimate kinase [Campylobacter sp. JMF_08 NE1]|uniref:shikimate kinase n=1 Tax=Campylobacter sp. JMF_08 NE1 TaxID=2983821 RepID=UPI0022E9CDE7|nr:shikimate kinase [Campylobacter sp. JMF_08 NE1]MDA3048700.1 shikimate kinase [Campylobacter sp. JMF_08 NE1]
MSAKNIILIGFMGVGKGTFARALAGVSGLFAIDCDDMIESYANKKIRKIFEEQGEVEFRKIEKKLAKFLEKNVSGAIISTGGGFYAVKNLNKIGTVIYLKSSFDAIIKRINSSENASKKIAKRPLLADLKKARALHEQRDKKYSAKADYIVNVEKNSQKEVIEKLLKIIKKEVKK